MTQDNARVQFAHCFSAPQGHLRSVTILKSVTSDVLTSRIYQSVVRHQIKRMEL